MKAATVSGPSVRNLGLELGRKTIGEGLLALARLGEAIMMRACHMPNERQRQVEAAMIESAGRSGCRSRS